MYSYSVTDTGMTREMNQDYFFASDTPVGNLPNLYIVADGMGGHKAGEYASRHTVERVVASVARNKGDEPINILQEAIDRANEILISESKRDETKNGMGTTLVICTIIDGKALVANVGDSRLYFVGNSITQVTKDHSLVQEMVRAGSMEPSEARGHQNKNIITRAIGAAASVEVDFFEVDVQSSDKLLLCSDGLTNMVEDDEILSIVKEKGSLEDAARALVTKANQNGGRDNITAMVIEI